MAVSARYALLSRSPLDAGFDAIRGAVSWIDGLPALLESADSLSIRRPDGDELMLRKIDLGSGDEALHYAAALVLRYDVDRIESAALAWEVLLAVLSEASSYDVWNAAYPREVIQKCAELRPLQILDTHGYVMRPSEFECLTELPPG